MVDFYNSKNQALFVPEKKEFGEKSKPTLLLLLHSAHTVYLVSCRSQNKQRLFPYTTLTDWFL